MEFKIGNVNVLPWLTDYNIQLTPQYGANSFTAENGDTISDYKGDKLTVTAALRRVPADTAAAISSIMAKKDFPCTVSAPFTLTQNFAKAAYRAEQYEKGVRWHFDITLESVGLVNSADSL